VTEDRRAICIICVPNHSLFPFSSSAYSNSAAAALLRERLSLHILHIGRRQYPLCNPAAPLPDFL
jgi:hypothetical protein